jgi:predicted regulator of Ras-like GTPase activity (Roadblock/LC7/MglB family)
VSPVLWAWLLSSAGALLFFAAGATWFKQRALRGAGNGAFGAAPDPSRTTSAGAVHALRTEGSTATNSQALQAIVDREVASRGAQSAVIADEIGLVIAASSQGSEHGEALAAFGVYLAEVGTRMRSALPLHEVRHVIVRDDRDTTLTVRPIEHGDHRFALVTLAEQKAAAQR